MSRSFASKALHWGLILFSVFGSTLYVYERHINRQTAAQFQLAVESAGAGQWFWDVEKNELRWDDRMFQLFHCSTAGWEYKDHAWVWKGGATKPPAEAMVRLLDSEDVPAVMAALQKALMTHGPYQAVYRVQMPDGKIAVLRASGQVYGGGRYVTGLCLEFAGDDGKQASHQSSYQVLFDSKLWAADPMRTP